MLTITPAYGRDYKTQKDAIADFKAGKDFIIANIMDPYDGKPCNITDLKNDGKHNSVMIRYSRLMKIAVVKF